VWDQPLISLFEEGHLRLFLPLPLAGIHQSDTGWVELYEIR
jgi:hypothetical protein